MSVLSDCCKTITSSVLDNNHLERDDYILSKVEQLKQEEFLKDVSDHDEVMSTRDKKNLIIYMPLSSGVNILKVKICSINESLDENWPNFQFSRTYFTKKAT